MSVESFLEIMDRVHNGPVCTTKEWETKVIPTKVSQKLKEHGLKGAYSPETIINTDDTLADEFFKAGFELAVEMGLQCTDTERVVKVTEEELIDAINNAPSELIKGTGRDVFVMKARKPEDPYPPELNGPLGLLVSEDIWVPLMLGFVLHGGIDTFQGGSIATMFGHNVLGGTPYETLLGRYQAQLTREVLWRAGKPGMNTVAVISSTTAFGQLGGYGINGGFDSANNCALILIPGELQTNYMTLHKVAHSINCQTMIQTGYTSMIGGYSGPPEGAILTCIAGFLLQLPIHQATFSASQIMDIRYSGNCGREGQWATSIALQAISRNTDLIYFGVQANQVAGPCTEMLLYESAVGMLNASASGAGGSTEPRSGGGRYPDYLTPLECKFCSEVLKRSAGMSRKQANEITKVLIPKYEDRLKDPPVGKSCRECYDLKTLKPTQEWHEMYLKVKKELIDLGVPLEYP